MPLAAGAAEHGTPRRGGGALAVELGYGGDRLDALTDAEFHAGQGISLMAGGFYRPREGLPLEIYGLAGWRLGLLLPITGGGYETNTDTPVLELLANYRFHRKWHVAGGLVSHLNPRLTTTNPAFDDVSFHAATGVTVEAGWSFIGLYYTYLEYSSSRGDFDASSVGLRFTVRLRK
jgi:hypothetical protein